MAACAKMQSAAQTHMALQLICIIGVHRAEQMHSWWLLPTNVTTLPFNSLLIILMGPQI